MMDFYYIEFKDARQSQLRRSIHYSTEDIHCPEGCATNCPSKFERCSIKNGEFVNMSDENRIGQGGFGSFFKGLFHGKDKAVKCVLIKRIEDRHYPIENAVSDLEKNIAEIQIQISSSGIGVIVPEAFIRQETEEQDENGKWIAMNYNIYIYPLYDCNLYELHENHYNQFTDEILRDILHQCLTRKGSVPSWGFQQFFYLR